MTPPPTVTNDVLALDARGIAAGYGSTQVLTDVDLRVGQCEIVSVLGRNGAGKSTLMNVLAGRLPARAGTTQYFGATARDASRIARLGVGYMPQDGCVFANLTVADNLRMSLGTALGPRLRLRGERVAEIFELFPRLRDRLTQRAGQLSGGERKMLSLCRVLLSDSGLLILDEPSEGVWPSLILQIAERLRAEAHRRSILIVEQNLDFALGLGGRCYVMDRGVIVLTGDTAQVSAQGEVARLLAP